MLVIVSVPTLLSSMFPPSRIKISPQRDAAGNIVLRFQHPAPTEVGELGSIGWREEDNLREQALLAAASGGGTVVATPVKVSGHWLRESGVQLLLHNWSDFHHFVHIGRGRGQDVHHG